MIRRILQSGLVAAVAAVAVFPAVAVADSGSAPVPGGYVASPQVVVVGGHVAPPQVSVPGRHGSLSGRPAAHAKRHHARVTKRHHARVAARLRGRVTTRHLSLNLRSGPGTGYRVIGSLRHDSRVNISCKKPGTRVRGNGRWYKVTHGKGYASARYVLSHGSVPWCR
jgi:uncharacterized protein YgiM (DUF1202 family)